MRRAHGAVQEQFSLVRAALRAKGALQALSFKGVGQNGVDVYEARFATPGALDAESAGPTTA